MFPLPATAELMAVPCVNPQRRKVSRGINTTPEHNSPTPRYARGASLVVQMVKSPPGKQETQVQSLGQEGPLEKGMATHSSILAWKIPWTEEPGRLQSVGVSKNQM